MHVLCYVRMYCSLPYSCTLWYHAEVALQMLVCGHMLTSDTMHFMFGLMYVCASDSRHTCTYQIADSCVPNSQYMSYNVHIVVKHSKLATHNRQPMY